MTYRCEARTVTGFVQQLACCYFRNGYHHYVVGQVPKKTLTLCDAKNRALPYLALPFQSSLSCRSLLLAEVAVAVSRHNHDNRQCVFVFGSFHSRPLAPDV